MELELVWILQILSVGSSVGSNSLVNPAAQIGHTGVYGRGTNVAVAGSPGHNANLGPNSTILTDQRATRVTLEKRHSDAFLRVWHLIKYDIQNIY